MPPGISLVNQLNAQDSPGAAETKNNVLIYNYIGTNAAVTAAIPNANAGLFIGPGANENIIGKPGEENVISGNNGLGILIGNSEQSTSSPTANKIQGNIIGLDYDSAKVPNTKEGIGVLFGTATIIGGDTEEAGNVIAGNGLVGIAIVGTSNTVRFNFIGTNREGALDLGNVGDGIKIESVTTQENTIADNTIGGNAGAGISIDGTAQTPPANLRALKQPGLRPNVGGSVIKIISNRVGVAKTGGLFSGIGNLGAAAIKILNASNVFIGNPTSASPANIIAGNSGAGIVIEGPGSTGNVIEGAIIGTDELGSAGLGNGGDGVKIVNAPANFIGGENKPGEPQRGNIIAGNTGNGVVVEGGNASGNAVQGNSIGVVNANGSVVKRGNGFLGIRIEGVAGNLIGLPGIGGLLKEQLGNVVAGNLQGGIMLQNASGTRISGNAVGTDHNNTLDLGNGGPGILMTGGTNTTTVGGLEAGSGNTITSNDGSGVRVDETGGEGNLVDPNSIYGNNAYGIDLGRRGHTPNDFGDPDTGPNRLQNYPEIISRQVDVNGQLIVSYRLTSAPANSNYGTAGIYIEFFKADPSGEGEKFLAFTHYTEADFNNGAPVVKQVNLGAVASLGIDPEDPVTATASDASGNTSEFSPPYSARVLVVTKTDDTINAACDPGNCSLREALAHANAGDEIQFASPLFDSAQTITLNGTELVVNKSVTLKGKGAHLLIINANNLSRVFNITDGAMPTLTGITITKGNALGNFIGGGVLNGGTLTLVDCHVTDNLADRGAGIYNTETLIVQASTISLNKANLGSATPAGGGIQSEDGVLEIVNSTISGNQATVSDGGGGIYLADGEATIASSTIANNSAPQGASNGGGIKNKDGVVTLRNSIVANNTAANPNLTGAFTSGGYNLVGANEGAANSFPLSNPVGSPNVNKDIVGSSATPADPQLDALGNYGGTTPTHRLQVGSPAIDKGRGFGSDKDQRGLPRPIDDSMITPAPGGDNSDIGAFEVQEVSTPSPTPTPTATPTPTPNTPAGSNVSIASSSGDASVTFGQVSVAGNTTFTVVNPPSSAGAPPQGFTILESGPAYDITTTAVYSPPVTVCFVVSSINDEAQFARVRILHGENGTLVDRTVLAPDSLAPNFATRTVCARVNSLSPFVAALAPNAPTAADGTVSGRIVDSNGNPVEGAVVRMQGTQNRKFITDANGFYSFDSVETNGFYTVTPSRVNYTFSPAAHSFSLLGQSTEATFGATANSQNANPLDTPEYFVRQHYLDFLGREPDESGFNFWSDQIIECDHDSDCVQRKRINVSAAYFLSVEFQQTGGFVDGLYRASFETRPNFAGFMRDIHNVAREVVVGRPGWEAKLDANKETLLQKFIDRPEFISAFSGFTNEAFVNTLISHTGVNFDQSERAALVSGLAAGTRTRAAVLRHIAEDKRFTAAKFNDAFVMMQYFGYLRRDPDESGYQFWLAKLNHFNGNFEQAEMLGAFLISGEFRARF